MVYTKGNTKRRKGWFDSFHSCSLFWFVRNFLHYCFQFDSVWASDDKENGITDDELKILNTIILALHVPTINMSLWGRNHQPPGKVWNIKCHRNSRHISFFLVAVRAAGFLLWSGHVEGSNKEPQISELKLMWQLSAAPSISIALGNQTLQANFRANGRTSVTRSHGHWLNLQLYEWHVFSSVYPPLNIFLVSSPRCTGEIINDSVHRKTRKHFHLWAQIKIIESPNGLVGRDLKDYPVPVPLPWSGMPSTRPGFNNNVVFRCFPKLLGYSYVQSSHREALVNILKHMVIFLSSLFSRRRAKWGALAE